MKPIVLITFKPKNQNGYYRSNCYRRLGFYQGPTVFKKYKLLLASDDLRVFSYRNSFSILLSRLKEVNEDD